MSIFCLAVWLCAGCAHLRETGNSEDLDHDADLYWKAWHWQDPVAASAFVDFDARADWLKVHDKQEKTLNITSWEMQSQKLDPGEQAATVLVKVTWFQLPSVIEQTDLAKQRWIYHGGHWLLVSEQGGPLPFP